MALHSLLDSPRDKVLWDVGHQAYPHKVLTGRRDQLHTIRKYERAGAVLLDPASPSTTSWAPATPRPRSATRSGSRRRCAAATARTATSSPSCGDGAMTGGVAFEAVHQAGGEGTPIVVLLNDNGMSIAPNVGALSRYFNRVRLNPKLWHAREERRGRPDQAAGRDRRRVRALRPALQGVDQGVLGPRPVVGGARLRLHGRDRRPRRRARAPRPARGAGRRAAGRRPLRDRQGQGVRPRRGGRPRGDGEVARGQAQVDRQRRPGAGVQARGRRAPGQAAGRPSTPRCSARRSSASASATTG